MAGLKPLKIHDLMVVDYETDELPPHLLDWLKKARVPFAASCSRQIWFGHVEDFGDFPASDEEKKKIRFLRAQDGYADLLAVLSGYESKRIGEHHIRGQFAQSWRQYTQEHPDEAKRIQAIVGQLRKDAGFIFNNISSGFKEVEDAQAARDLTGQKKDDYVALVAGISRHGEITPLTERMIRVSENLQKKGQEFIIVVPPAEAAFPAVRAGIESLKSQKKIRPDSVLVYSHKDISRAIEDSKHVYVLSAMGESALTDKLLVKAWQERANSGGTLVHVRGDPLARGASDTFWAGAGLENYISPEMVQEELRRRTCVNAQIIENAKAAFGVCAALRAKGQLPERCIPQEYPELLEARGC